MKIDKPLTSNMYPYPASKYYKYLECPWYFRYYYKPEKIFELKYHRDRLYQAIENKILTDFLGDTTKSWENAKRIFEYNEKKVVDTELQFVLINSILKKKKLLDLNYEILLEYEKSSFKYPTSMLFISEDGSLFPVFITEFKDFNRELIKASMTALEDSLKEKVNESMLVYAIRRPFKLIFEIITITNKMYYQSLAKQASLQMQVDNPVPNILKCIDCDAADICEHSKNKNSKAKK